MRLQSKIWMGVGAVILSIMTVDLYVGFRMTEAHVRAELDQNARIARAILMATSRVYHAQFMTSGLQVGPDTVGFLPAHSLSRISKALPEWIDSALRFNNVSDRARNPDNAADASELIAMNWFREHPQATERIAEVRDDAGRALYHFSAPIWIEPYCLGCHGEREAAPASVRETYAEAYGYRMGDLRGILSIKVPMDEVRAHALKDWWHQFGLRAGGYALLLLLLGVLLRRLVVRPLAALTAVTRQLEAGDLSRRATLAGDDEVAVLAAGFNDMADALDRRNAQVARLNRIYAALFATDQTILRGASEPELLRQICEIAVKEGGAAMAWIGRRDPQTDFLVAVERSGRGVEYADGLAIPLEPFDPAVAGPSARAWRSGRPVIVQDFLVDASTRPWLARAAAYGWRASAAFPILRGGQVHLVLNLYDSVANAFDAKRQELLAEMAIDIGHALDRIDLDAEQARVHAELAESEAKYRSVLETSQDGFWLVDCDGRLTEVNDAYLVFSGYRRDELIGMHVADLDATDSREQVARRMQQIAAEGSCIFETHHRTRSGEVKPVEVSVTCVAGRAGCFSAFLRDLSSRNEADERIRRLSQFDALTGLPNRSLFTDLVHQGIAQAQRSGEPLGLIYLDIDHFKNINDSLGHRIGDLMLVEIAKRLRSAVRAEDTLARLGGDEFLILLPRTDADSAAHVAAKLIDVGADPLLVEGHEMAVTLSIGIAMYPIDGDDLETLLRKADTAANRAKSDGRNTFRFFTAEMQQRSARILRLEAGLRRAVERHELRLHYQPQIDLIDGGRVVGVEALIRWQHPELGTIPPAEFIPIAENSGLILPIGDWVMRTALRQLKRWREAGLPLDQVAVNLSARQFRRPKLPLMVERILAEVGLPASCLELELTESVAMDDPVAAVAMMDALHLQGVRIAIDDFGTGHSSLNYLKRFRIDKLKIDQSFVRDLTHDPEGKAIVEAIVSLARTLGFRTVAEGVETAEQLALVRSSGCREGQGYLFSRPLAPDDLSAWLLAWRPDALADGLGPHR